MLSNKSLTGIGLLIAIATGCAADKATGTSCSEIFDCAQTCNSTDSTGYPACVSDCSALGTPAAQATFDSFTVCFMTKCGAAGADGVVPCADPASDSCVNCFALMCNVELTACTEDVPR